MELGFFDGQFVELTKACARLEDRGYQFGDGIYEVTRVHKGKCFALERHLARCRRSLKEMRIPITYMDEELTAIHTDLIHKSGIAEGYIYLQITRGVAPRNHYFPDQVVPILSATIREGGLHDGQDTGIKVTLQEDIRWLRCDVKSLNLLGAVIAKQAAHEGGFGEALLYRKDTRHITEGSSSNFFAVKDGLVWTHPANNLILKGVTRSIIIEEILPQLDLTLVEKPFTPEWLYTADEAFITSTGHEATAVIAVDEKQIGDGKPGKITQDILAAFKELTKKAVG
ncbi:MAG: D-amino-acid transaminase [Selenomonadaceae bacterium]|nr:D-amino-acid transaminase [Selenomonadaceae bacterium]